MISAVAQPGYITTEDDTYTLRMAPTGPTTFNFQVTRTYLDGTSDYVLYQSADETFSGPYVLDIERDGDDYVFLVNGTVLYTTGNAAGDLYNSATRDAMAYYQIVMAGDGAMNATVDDFGVATRELASAPNPEDAGIDVLRNVVLTWQPGEFAVTHNVYFGTSFDDVNVASADVLVGDGQDANSLDLGRLALGQTYYWRVDEVNGAPDKTIFKGAVWRFEVEAVAIPVENVTVTASSSNADNMGPENTINGVGLNELDQHSTEPTDMWLSGMGDPNPSIQYEFDRAYKLHEMLVWNSNQLIEAFVGIGARDVVIEYSLDGAEWTILDGATQFAQAPGAAGYTANTMVDFGGALAQYVKITINGGYGVLPQSGLSAVRFLYTPTFAREPQPSDGSSTESADIVLSWRSGREAASREVYLGTEPADLALLGTTDDNRYDAGALNYDSTYYWQIIEVNENEAPAAHAGPVWSFSTPAHFVVDDFESYDDECDRIFFSWLDGIGHNGAEDCGIGPYNGNGSGSIVGNSLAPFAEQTTVHAGAQSMPLEYDSGMSEATLSLDGQDWTASEIKTLSLMVFGSPDNTGQMYVKINNAKVVYEGDTPYLQMTQWLPWNIDLSTVGGSLANVTTLTIGVDGANAPGKLYVDTIHLSPQVLPDSITALNYDDFTTNPNIATDWTEYAFYASDVVTPTWNSADEDLDLVKTGGSGSVGLYRTGAYRSATDPVTLTVKELSRTDGGWGFLGLMISAVAQYGYVADTDDSYTLAIASTGVGTSVRYEVRRTYQDGTGDFQLYVGDEFDLAAHGPVTLDILRVGDDYQFLADGVLLYTTAVPAAGDFYDRAAKDALVNFQIVMPGDGAMSATVDDFGVPQ
jgi:hypothetical protein